MDKSQIVQEIGLQCVVNRNLYCNASPYRGMLFLEYIIQKVQFYLDKKTCDCVFVLNRVTYIYKNYI